MIFNKFRNNQSGLSLIELLATLSLTSIIVISASAILVKGTEHFQMISTENALRDEADLIMVKLYKELYTTKLSEIDVLKHETNGSYKNSYLLYKEKILADGSSIPKQKTGFINDKLFIKDEEYNIQNSNIKLNTDTSKSSITETSDDTYMIKIVLYMKDKNKTMEFVNEVSIINDEEAETNGGN